VIARTVNRFFPLAPTPLHAAPDPSVSLFTMLSVPDAFGSGILSGAYAVMMLLDIPFLIYAAVLCAGAALSFEDLEKPVAEGGGPPAESGGLGLGVLESERVTTRTLRRSTLRAGRRRRLSEGGETGPG
jgi:hypothetical protein